MGRVSIQPSEGRLFQAEVPTELQHHSILPTSAHQRSPEWWLFMNKGPMGCFQCAFYGQNILKYLQRQCKQPVPTQTRALPTPESSRMCSWPEEIAPET